MKKKTIIFIVFAVLIILGGVAVRFLIPYLQERSQQNYSAAANIKATVNVAGDNYLGYWFINSPEFQYLLHEKGYAVNWSNDNGDYTDRNAKFAQGKYDIMVLPVNSYIANGADNKYPGVIVAAISDSKGADSILAYKDKILPSNNRDVEVNDLNNSTLKFGFTPNSPSSFLLSTAIVHFDLSQLKNSKDWVVETPDGSAQAFEKLKDKSVDIAVLWEPDVTKALNLPGVVQVFGSDQISGMIIDVFVVNRQYLANHTDIVVSFFDTYFETLNYYSARQDEMTKEMVKTTGLDQKSIESAIKRIAWFDKQENSRDWFTLNTQIQGQRAKIVDTIFQVIDVMLDVKDLDSDYPLKFNTYTIIASDDILAKIYNDSTPLPANIGAPIPTGVIFTDISQDEWAKLKVIGALKVLPILFQSGTSQLTNYGSVTVDQVALALSQNYPQYRVIIKGHTAPSSDEIANIALSKDRAETVKSYLVMTYGIDANRVLALGMGSKEALPRALNEGELSYRSRLPRIEFILLEK